MTVPADQVRNYTRAALERESASNFTRFRRVPSTYTWKAVDHVSALDGAGRNALFDALAAQSVASLEPPSPASIAPAVTAFVDALGRMTGWQYLDARSLRMILADLRSTRPSPELRDTPAEVLARAETIRPTTAADIRRAVKSAFTEAFGVRVEKRPGGVWRYAGVHGGRPFVVQIDYGGRSDQLRYEVQYVDERTGVRALRLTYERLLGLGLGRWDFVTADNLESSVTLLVEFVGELVALPELL